MTFAQEITGTRSMNPQPTHFSLKRKLRPTLKVNYFCCLSVFTIIITYVYRCSDGAISTFAFRAKMWDCEVAKASLSHLRPIGEIVKVDYVHLFEPLPKSWRVIISNKRLVGHIAHMIFFFQSFEIFKCETLLKYCKTYKNSHIHVYLKIWQYIIYKQYTNRR